MNDWIGSCYPAPSDRTINTGDQICQKGIDYKTIKNGEKETRMMWRRFFYKLLK